MATPLWGTNPPTATGAGTATGFTGFFWNEEDSPDDASCAPPTAASVASCVIDVDVVLATTDMLAFTAGNAVQPSPSSKLWNSSSSYDSYDSSGMNPSMMSCAPATVASLASCPGTTMSATPMAITVATLPPAVTTSNGCPMPVRVKMAQYRVSFKSLTFGFVVYSRS